MDGGPVYTYICTHNANTKLVYELSSHQQVTYAHICDVRTYVIICDSVWIFVIHVVMKDIFLFTYAHKIFAKLHTYYEYTSPTKCYVLIDFPSS